MIKGYNYELFEYIFVDPLAVWKEPEILYDLSVRQGFILIHEQTQNIIEQIEILKPKARNSSKLKNIKELLLNLRLNDALIPWHTIYYQRKTDKISNPLQRPKFIQDTDHWSNEKKQPFVCVLSEKNRNFKNSINKLGRVVTLKEFKKYEVGTKGSSIIQRGSNNAEILKKVLNPGIFRRCVKQLDIVDHLTYYIGLKDHPKDYEKTVEIKNYRLNYLKTIEEMCERIHYYYYLSKPLYSEPLKLNIYFRQDKYFRESIFQKEITKYIKNSVFFSKIKGALNLNFFSMLYSHKTEYDPNSPVKVRFCFSDSFLTKQDVGICSIPGKSSTQGQLPKPTSTNYWELNPTGHNPQKPDQIHLETVKSLFLKIHPAYTKKLVWSVTIG